MMRMICLAAALAVVSTAARADDASYCKALGDKYMTYVSNMQAGRSPMPESPDVRIAIEQCNKGNTAAGIPVLEQKLRNARIDLPPRG
jgi:hypothetical protein